MRKQLALKKHKIGFCAKLKSLFVLDKGDFSKIFLLWRVFAFCLYLCITHRGTNSLRLNLSFDMSCTTYCPTTDNKVKSTHIQTYTKTSLHTQTQTHTYTKPTPKGVLLKYFFGN